MRVKLLADHSGSYVDSDGVPHLLGVKDDEIDLPAELAEDMIRQGNAVQVGGKAKAEAAKA